MIGFQQSATKPDLGANQNELQLGEQLSLMLEDSKWQLETILDEQNDVFAVLDTQRRILRSNQALARLLGCDPELCIGSTLESLLAPESLEMFRTLVSEVFHESDRNLSSSRKSSFRCGIRKQEP
jgi:PAS domain S-box-containing protein